MNASVRVVLSGSPALTTYVASVAAQEQPACLVETIMRFREISAAPGASERSA